MKDKSSNKNSFKLSQEQEKMFNWLKNQGLNTDDNTLNYWCRMYPESRLKEVVQFAQNRQRAGQVIRNLGGWIHKLLLTGLAVENEECKHNRKLAEDFARMNKWNELKIYEKYIKEEITGDDLPLTMEKNEFKRSLKKLYDKSQLYKRT
jgi:DNA phosphorothioation-dependent restriction protein DptG